MTSATPLPDPQQVQTVLDTLEADFRLHQISRPDNGLTGNVFVLQTESQDLILRAFSDTDAAWKPKKEHIVYSLLRRQGIPVPNILKIDLTRSCLPFAYAVSERLPGATLSQRYATLNAGQRVSIYGQLGDYLGRIHSLSFPAFGDVAEHDGAVKVGPAHELMAKHSGPFVTWNEMHHQIVQRHLRFLQSTEFGDLTKTLDIWFREHDSLLDELITPRLLHMDLHCGNILAIDDQITGILDVEESLIGHQEYDLMRTELAHFRGDDEGIQAAFFETYLQHISLDEGYEQRKSYYELSRNLVGMRCLVTYGSRYLWDTESERRAIRARVQELMAH